MIPRPLRIRFLAALGITLLWLVLSALSAAPRSSRAAKLESAAFISPIGTPQLSLIKTVDNPAPKPDDLITYNLTYSNTQAGTQAFNVKLYDFLPAGVQFVSANPSPTSNSNGVLLFASPSVGPTTNDVTVQVNVRVLAGYAQLLNHALLVADDTPPAQASLATNVQKPSASLSLSKTGYSSALAGGQLVYTLIAGNTSGNTASNVTVVDVLPAGVSFVAASLAPTTLTPPVVSWSMGSLAPGEQRTIVVTTTAPASTGVITNTALADAQQAVVTQTLFSTQVITQGPLLRVTKQGPAVVNKGDTLVYTIHYWNDGNQAATGVLLTDTLPANINVIATEPPTMTVSAQQATLSIGTIGAASPVRTIVITATIGGPANRTLLNTVDVTAQNGIPAHAEWPTQVRPALTYLPLVRKNN